MSGRRTRLAPLTQLGSGAKGAPDELVADCIACHSTGPLPTEDVLRDYLRDNGALIGYPPNIPWPTEEELDAVIAADSGAYKRVLERAGFSIEFAGALQMITRRYAAGLNLADMAAAVLADSNAPARTSIARRCRCRSAMPGRQRERRVAKLVVECPT